MSLERQTESRKLGVLTIRLVTSGVGGDLVEGPGAAALGGGVFERSISGLTRVLENFTGKSIPAIVVTSNLGEG